MVSGLMVGGSGRTGWKSGLSCPPGLPRSCESCSWLGIMFLEGGAVGKKVLASISRII